MKFTVTIKTPTATYRYPAISSSSWALWESAFDTFGISEISVIRHG